MGRMLCLALGVDILRAKVEPGTTDLEVVAWANRDWAQAGGMEWYVQSRADGNGEVILRTRPKSHVEGDMDVDYQPRRRGVGGEADCPGK